jgi:hypothetical protein
MKTKAALFLLMVIAFSCHLAGAEEPGNKPAFAPHDTARSRSVGA